MHGHGHGHLRLAQGGQSHNGPGHSGPSRRNKVTRSYGRPSAHSTQTRSVDAAIVASAIDACPPGVSADRTKAHPGPTADALLVRPHSPGYKDKRPVDCGKNIARRVVWQRNPHRFVASKRRPVVGQLGVALHWDAGERPRFLKPWEEHSDFHIAEWLFCRQCPVDGYFTVRTGRYVPVTVREALGRLDRLSWLSQGHGLGDGFVHVMSPRAADGRVEGVRLERIASQVSHVQQSHRMQQDGFRTYRVGPRGPPPKAPWPRLPMPPLSTPLPKGRKPFAAGPA